MIMSNSFNCAYIENCVIVHYSINMKLSVQAVKIG